jgi:L-fuconolactonase
VIIDSQVHLWTPDTPDRPWPTDRPNDHNPQRERPLEAPEMLALMDEAGVDRAVIVPPIWAGDDNLSAMEWCTEYPDRLAIMGRFDLWDPDRERIERWLDQPGMLGIRMSYPRERGTEWLMDPDEVRWFWDAAERLNIPIMLFCMGTKPVRAIAEAHPGLRLIIDHLGLRIVGPTSGPEVDPFEHLDDLLGLGEFPNVYGKFSSLPSYSRTAYPFPDLAGPLEAVFDSFGARRLMWGSDVTRLRNATYAECVEHVRSGLDFLSDEDRDWVLGSTAASVLGWPTGDRA